MTLYHVNPKTGNPAVCRAEDANNCPFGGAAGHTTDPMECFTIYGRVMADYTCPKPFKQRGPVMPERLQAILTWVNPLVIERRAYAAQASSGLNLGPLL